MTAAVEFIDVSKRFPGMTHPALDHVSLTIDEGEFVTVLGTSGGGKTTLIKLINRLHDPDEGVIKVEGKDVQEIDPVTLRRSIDYVIQQTGLFPHMTVRDNIATVPKILKWDKARIDARVDELEKLGKYKIKESSRTAIWKPMTARSVWTCVPMPDRGLI